MINLKNGDNMKKNDIKKTIISITNKHFKTIQSAPNKDDINLQDYIEYDESFLLFTIELEKAFDIEFDPALEYDELASMNSLSDVICELLHAKR